MNGRQGSAACMNKSSYLIYLLIDNYRSDHDEFTGKNGNHHRRKQRHGPSCGDRMGETGQKTSSSTAAASKRWPMPRTRSIRRASNWRTSPATSQAEVADRLIGEALARFGQIDTLVNNAGIFVSKPFTDFTPADYESVLSTNVSGFFYVTQRAAAEMLNAGNGHIINITASGAAEQPIAAVPSVLAALTKGGLNAATRSLAIEYADKGIRVNAIAPGITKTPMHAEETHAFLAKLHPVGPMGKTEDIVEAIFYLESARFVTGEILHVDGGRKRRQLVNGDKQYGFRTNTERIEGGRRCRSIRTAYLSGHAGTHASDFGPISGTERSAF